MEENNKKYTTIRLDGWLVEELRKGMSGADTIATAVTRNFINSKLYHPGSDGYFKAKEGNDKKFNTINGVAEIGDTVVAMYGPSGKYIVNDIRPNEFGQMGMDLLPKDKYTKRLCNSWSEYAILEKGNSNEE